MFGAWGNAEKGSQSAPLRQAAVLLLVLLATLWATFRIGIVSSGAGDTAALSANDRSRWATVAALVHHGTYAIDDIIIETDPVTGARREDKRWQTIDRVKHKGNDGWEHNYSSKPPLLPTLVAGEYWLMHAITGWDITEEPILVIRSLLILTNIPLYLLVVFIGVGWAHRYCATGWAVVFATAIITWGTFLMTFSSTLNNHLVAAASAAVALEAYLRIKSGPRHPVLWSLLGGAAAAFTAANELPALSFLCGLALLYGIQSRKWLFAGYLPGALVVACAFFGTNWLAHGSLVPAYGHRSDGPEIARIPYDRAVMAEGLFPEAWKAKIPIDLSEDTQLLPHDIDGRWMIWDRIGQDRLAVIRHNGALSIRTWENWYDYPGSYWVSGRKSRIDRGEPSRFRYAFHITLGHHGIFSLSPIWFLSLIGGVWWYRSGRYRLELASILALTVVCILFYIFRPQGDRNYGGSCCGLRWMFWLIPMWFFSLLPALDRLASMRGYRQMANLAFLVSIISAVYAYANPWQHPWLYQLFVAFPELP